MSDDPSHDDQLDGRRPSIDHPLNAEPRRSRTAVFAVLAAISAIVVLFFVITVVRYTT